MKKIMKSYIALLLITTALFMNFVSANSQEAKLSREEKKAQRKADSEYNFKVLDSLMTVKKFILVAEYTKSATGDRTPIEPSLNFFKVLESKGIIQTSSVSSMSGIPREGSIVVYDFSKNIKSQSVNLRFDINTQIGRFDILLDVLATNLATVTISGPGINNLTWEGHIETIERRPIFRGQN
jgi:hypothetical protein